MKMVTPWLSARRRSRALISMMPAGSSPFRLVQDEELGRVDESASEREPLLVPEREHACQSVSIFSQLHELYDLINGRRTGAGQAALDLEVFPDRKVGIRRCRLHEVADARKDTDPVTGERGPQDRHLARARPNKAQQHPDGGGLTRAVSAEKAVDFPAADVEVDVYHGLHGSVALGQTPCPDCRSALD